MQAPDIPIYAPINFPRQTPETFPTQGMGATVVGVHSGAPEYDTNSKLAILFGRSCSCSGTHLNNKFYP
jgi:hypothetical protein